MQGMYLIFVIFWNKVVRLCHAAGHKEVLAKVLPRVHIVRSLGYSRF